ncbi:peptidoglycan DD-metalloendopeptidase family protein [Streptomyces sp. ODS28]|uniref:M23 family metallopeptidase n=1 Tax=Streptomyces sp. ODS28 TaxID=3136688 RepID=UPI0031E5588F
MVNQRHPSGDPGPADTASEFSYAAFTTSHEQPAYGDYDGQGAPPGHANGFDAYDGYATGTFDNLGFSYGQADTAYGTAQNAPGGYAAGQWDTGQYDANGLWGDGTYTGIPAQQGLDQAEYGYTAAQWDAAAYAANGYDTGAYDTGAFAPGAFNGNAFDTGTYDTGAFDTSSFDAGAPQPGAYDTGAFDTGAFQAGGYDASAADPNATGAHAFDTGAFDTGAFATGSYGTGPADTGTFDTGTFDTGAFDTGAFDTGAFQTGAYDTAAFPNGVPDSAGYATGQWDSGAWDTNGHSTAYEGYEGHETYGQFTGYGHTDGYGDAGAQEQPPHTGQFETMAVPGAGFGAGEATEQFAPIDATSEFPAYDIPSYDGVEHSAADARPEPSAIVPPQPRSGGRRRPKARRSALMTVAVPSVAVLGVAGAAAASVASSGTDAEEESTTTTQAEGATGGGGGGAPVKPSKANSKLDSQFAKLSEADDFADRASRTQERIDLKKRQAEERKRKAEEAARKEAMRPKFSLPVDQKGLSATFGSAGVNWMSLHSGIDFPVSEGTPVKAATDGTVTTQFDVSFGNMAKVTSKDGTETWYCHLSSTKIRSGEVKAGDVIGYSGTTGNSTGPHLHFEVHPGGGDAVDPLPWLRDKGLNPE